MSALRIAIIGGGLSGLATAVHLRLIAEAESRPVELTLFEASHRVGGVIHAERIKRDNGDEFIVDHGADMFAMQPPAGIELCRRLGVEDRLLRPKPEGRGAMIWRRNTMLPIPAGFVLMRPTKLLSMLTTKLLSPRGKLRLLRERFVPARNSEVQDESVGSFVTRRLGSECLNNIVAPLVAGIYTADVHRLSMAATMKPIWEMESTDGSLAGATLRRLRAGEDSTERGSSGARYEQFRAFPGGMVELIQILADRIGSDNIRLQSPIASLAHTPAGIRLGDSGEVFDRVVLSTPAAITAKLLATLQSTLPTAAQVDAVSTAVANLQAIQYASTAIVVMAVPRDRIASMPKAFGFVVPPSERRSVLAGSFASEKFPGRAPEDHVIIRAFVGGVLHPEILQNSDEALIQIVTNELGAMIGLDQSQDVTEFAAFTRVVRWNNAMPQYEVGHLERAQAIQTAMQSIPQVDLVTNAFGGVGIAAVIGNAERTATALMASPSEPER